MKEKVAAGLQKLKQNQLVAEAYRITAPARENPFPLQMLFTILYRLVLDLVYVYVVSPAWSYAGFTVMILPLRYLLSLLTAIVFVPIVVHILNDCRPSAILISFINYLYFIPLTSFFGCHGAAAEFFLVSATYWALLLLLQSWLPRITFKKLSDRYMNVGMIGLTSVSALFVLAISGIYTGFRFTLNFIDVYEIRAEAAGYQLPLVASYLLDMMPVVLSICLICWLIRKKWLIAIALVIVYLFLYSIAAHKMVFFFLVLMLGVFFLYRDWMLRWMPGLLVLASGVNFIEQVLGGSSFMYLFFKRMMYTPVRLSEKYSTFFAEYPLNLFQDGIMGKLSFDNVYSTSIPRVIGEYMGDYWTNANNGLIGDMYANLPVLLGVLTMPLVLVICFRLLDLAAAKVDRRIVIPFCVYYANSFMNGSWSTVLLSHGFLISCLLLYFFPKGELSK